MILSLINKIETAISSSSIILSSNIDKYFGATKKEAYISGNLTFIDLSSLEFAIYFLDKGKKVIFDKYRFQYMDSRKKHIFRYDNAPHHKEISTFPLHKHIKNKSVTESAIPKFNEILEEIAATIAQSF